MYCTVYIPTNYYNVLLSKNAKKLSAFLHYIVMRSNRTYTLAMLHKITNTPKSTLSYWVKEFEEELEKFRTNLEQISDKTRKNSNAKTAKNADDIDVFTIAPEQNSNNFEQNSNFCEQNTKWINININIIKNNIIKKINKITRVKQKDKIKYYLILNIKQNKILVVDEHLEQFYVQLVSNFAYSLCNSVAYSPHEAVDYCPRLVDFALSQTV